MSELSLGELEGRLENFIFSQLGKDTYKVIRLPARQLLTWNRFDLSLKLSYLKFLQKNHSMALNVYKEDIRAQTLGRFSEFGNDDKNDFSAYVEEFKKTFSSIKNDGFDPQKSLVPLSTALSINNGAHRIASCISLDCFVDCLYTEQSPLIVDYKYFRERNVSENLLSIGVKTFIEHADNVYIAFLWPLSGCIDEEVEPVINNIVYKKTIKLSPLGAYNLIIELYKHMDWIGNVGNGFEGAKRKMLECFPNFDAFTVIAFQAESLDAVREVKVKVRELFNVGYSSIHITDTQEEALRISSLVFSENGLHFLNYASPYRYLGTLQRLSDFKDYLQTKGINPSDIVVDGGTVLALYGLRDTNDLDWLGPDDINKGNEIFEIHDSELVYHKLKKEQLIYDPAFNFEYDGLKFVSFHQLFSMKEVRCGDKDKYDRELMRGLINRQWHKKFSLKVRQEFFYQKIKIKRKSIDLGLSFLRAIGLHGVLKKIYWKLKK